MIYEINCGHCVSGNDSGAEGCGFREQDLTRLVGNSVMSKLRAQGHTVINCTVDSANSVRESLNSICSKANSVNADIFVSIHLNASDTLGHGTEIWTYGGKEVPQARIILNNIVSMGYSNRGIKDGSHLAVVRNTHCTAFLVELCFIDNSSDMKLFNVEKMANAIVLGLTGKTTSVSPSVSQTPIKFRKECVVLADKLNCRKAPSTNGDLIKQFKLNDKLTIVNTDSTGKWGALSFGNNSTGWVSLDYIKYTDISPTPQSQIKFRKECVVNCQTSLNCRKSPIDGEIIKSYKNGDRLTIVDFNDSTQSWGKLSFGDNNYGFICLKYVKFL